MNKIRLHGFPLQECWKLKEFFVGTCTSKIKKKVGRLVSVYFWPTNAIKLWIITVCHTIWSDFNAPKSKLSM